MIIVISRFIIGRLFVYVDPRSKRNTTREFVNISGGFLYPRGLRVNWHQQVTPLEQVT